MLKIWKFWRSLIKIFRNKQKYQHLERTAANILCVLYVVFLLTITTVIPVGLPDKIEGVQLNKK